MLFGASLTSPLAADSWLVFPADQGPGQGKHIVFIAAEEACRSEESMPVIAHNLSREGIKCTVLFAIDPADDTINPKIKDTIPGLEKLDTTTSCLSPWHALARDIVTGRVKAVGTRASALAVRSVDYRGAR
jgi:hypothetical protein